VNVLPANGSSPTPRDVLAGVVLAGGIAAATAFGVTPLWSQDPQPSDPPESTLSWQARIAPVDEPGEPLLVSGRVFDPEGDRPVAGVVVYAYHTDVKGLYTPTGAARPPRLQGWARTDDAGRYEFRTIRPAAYPGDGPPAHVHFSLWGAGYPRQSAEELQFEDDPKVTKEMLQRSRRQGQFGGVRPVARGADGVWRCTFDMRLRRVSGGGSSRLLKNG
jgi:protocatechuate 3,4-dioxygenase beta subunit